MITLTGILLAGGAGSEAWANKGVYEWALVRLDFARKEKVRHLKRFSDRIHALAVQAAEDPSVIGCFDIGLQYAAALEKGPVPQALTAKIEDLQAGFNRYYIENYFSFYDILFVDGKGKVFYTIRKEEDLHADLLKGDPPKSLLARCLAQKPEREAFVDFHHYSPSAKPAAFFVEPVRKDNLLMGWIVFQCAINKVNTIFSGTEDLGRTGETFLVNWEGLMLTESNFIGDSTILKKRLDDRNIQAKFEDRQGNRTVVDYRGYAALTSFEVVDFLGTRWLVVAKMDKDEVITQHYARYRRYYSEKLLTHLSNTPPPPMRAASLPVAEKTLRIDMDEFIKANNGERLQTFGVSTCTGLIASYPEKFAYMAHISPIDKIYGEAGTNLVGQMINKIKSFDIYPCEKRAIGFAVVAPHLDSLLPIIDKLVAEGFLLSQIRVLYTPKASSATISYDCGKDNLHVFWRLAKNSGSKHFHILQDASNAGEIVRQVMQSEEGKRV
ncbi:MAG: cache domain-containing protein [Desulfobacterales bacterium]|nr:cache domain-containing protein [Desulfobacterales bacterium]